MAAVTELCFLLFVLVSNIHTEQRLTIQKEGASYEFTSPRNETNYCLISRFVGEEKLVLWNTSELWSENSTVPEDLKQRLSVLPLWNISFYQINNLTYSDSGLYQETCWTKNTETHEKNIRIIICLTMNKGNLLTVKFGQTVDLPCKGAADNLTHFWLKKEQNENTWTRVFGDSTTSVTDNKGRFQVVETTSALRVKNFTIRDILTYNCLLMNQQLCVSSNPVYVRLKREFLYYTVEDTAVLQCPISDFSDGRPPVWLKDDLDQTVLGENRSLIISPLMLNDSGCYSCETFSIIQYYILFVCPQFGPPVVQLFSEGEDVTLTCGDKWGKSLSVIWFMKSEQTNGKTISVYEGKYNLNSRFTAFRSNGTLIISNVSLKDTGDYWCAVTDFDFQCVSTVKYVVKRRDPFGISSTFYRVWSSLLSALLMMLCVVVAVVNHRTRRPEQLRADTLTPSSDQFHVSCLRSSVQGD
ncbi:hypothetical protein Q5P01_009514 [Channa striata]|uniref:Ig-like domain-containing protein n=1 Tax=Channa striata TaxID=64152 RepID=A0AA88N0L0_CHASR|nr:hypothetical protein Q5P01_009514 [Channa striata]